MPVDDSQTPLARLPRLPGLPGWPRLPLPVAPDPARLAVTALNALLKREAWARERLIRHAGKTARLAVGRFSTSLTFTSEGYAQPADAAIVPDVTVTLNADKLTLGGLLAMRASKDGSAIMDITHISGDAGLAQVVGELARHLRWDVEDELAQRIGDIPAARLTQGVRTLAQNMHATGLNLATNMAEYLAYERHVLLARPVFNDHVRALADTAAELDALTARVNRLTPPTERP